MYIPRAAVDPRVHDAERSLLAAGDDALLVRIVRQSGPTGILALCLKTGKQKQHGASDAPVFAAIDETTVLICAALLSAYVPEQPALPTPRTRRPRKPGRRKPARACFPAADSETAIERERERIAGDIHDGVAQQLASVLHMLDLAQRVLDSRPDFARQQLAGAARQLAASITELRSVITSPRPFLLETRGLEAALRLLVDDIQRDVSSLSITFECDDLSHLPVSLETVVYRLAQEGLANARKHARAARIMLRAHLLKGMLVVEISDDGRGFDLEQVSRAYKGEHLGLRVMRSRVQQAGGTWEIQSSPGAGTLIRARFPLPVPLPSTLLTPREREVLRLIARGMTNHAIAETLSVSSETVKSHLHHIMQKMHVHDRTQAAVAAARLQLV